MRFERVMLMPGVPDAWLDIYIADPVGKFVRNAILVIPGGGYGNVCSDREGEPIGMAFMPYGYNAFVLHYSVARTKAFPTQLIQASLAMQHIKTHAEEYNIDPEKVFVTGFSAGGHLAGSLGILWHLDEIYQATGMPYGINKPAGMMLVYPVITSDAAYSHPGSFRNLLCSDDPSPEALEKVSLEKQVDERSAPLYLMHTSNDQLVDIRNALVLADAYAKAGLTFEMHIYPDAPHGVALGNAITKCGVEKHDNPCIAQWVEHAVRWAERL